MSDKPISPLRQRLLEDMTVRNFVEKTKNDYVRHVKSLAAFLGRSPDTATPEDLRRFQLDQTKSGVRPPTVNGSVAALRFFFTVTLDRPEMARHLTFVHEPRRVPIVMSPEEVARFLESAQGPKWKAALSAAYGAGLRVSEVVALKVSDVDSQRMLLQIEQGKGRKDRHAMLSSQLLELLRDWYRIARPPMGRGRLWAWHRVCRTVGREARAGVLHQHPCPERAPSPSGRSCTLRSCSSWRVGRRRGSLPEAQTSVFSAISSASSISTPR